MSNGEEYPGYVPGPDTPLVPVHIPDPPGQQVTYKMAMVDPRIICQPDVPVVGTIPVAGTVGVFSNVVTAIPWNGAPHADEPAGPLQKRTLVSTQ